MTRRFRAPSEKILTGVSKTLDFWSVVVELYSVLMLLRLLLLVLRVVLVPFTLWVRLLPSSSIVREVPVML